MSRDTGWGRNYKKVGELAADIACNFFGLKNVSKIQDYGGIDATDRLGHRVSIKGDQTILDTGNVYHQIARVGPNVPLHRIRDEDEKTSANTADRLIFVTNGGVMYACNTHDLMQTVIKYNISLERIKPTSIGYLVPVKYLRERPTFRQYVHRYMDLERGALMPSAPAEKEHIDPHSVEFRAKEWLVFNRSAGCPYDFEGKDKELLRQTIERLS